MNSWYCEECKTLHQKGHACNNPMSAELEKLASDKYLLMTRVETLEALVCSHYVKMKCDALIIDNLRQQLHLMNDLKKAAIDYVHCEKVPVEPQHEQWMIKMDKLEAICHELVKLIERTQNNETTKEE